MPKDAKPFKGVGRGVIEIAIKHNKEAKEKADNEQKN